MSDPLVQQAKPSNRQLEINRDEVYTKSPDGEPILFPTPLHMVRVLMPDLLPYDWQAEELLRLGGYLDPYNENSFASPNPEHPFMYCLAAANGSGKDLVLIASFAVWFALRGLRNFCFITSASDDQIKTQTQPHIRLLCEAANKKFGRIFRSVDKYHVCTQTASEIKLFVTDEAGRAEGLHPRFGGQMALIFNEAKTIPPDLWSAYARCTGFSYWLEISSPGIKSGHFFESSREAICYPSPAALNKYFHRKITAYDCPHIPRSHIDRQIREQPKEWVDSSINAEFSDFGEENVVKESTWDESANILPGETFHQGYGIGGDFAAQGADECTFYCRKGWKIHDKLFFRQSDTTLTAEIFDTHFNYLKNEQDCRIFLDDGNVGHAIIDMLLKMGWQNIVRCHNQGSARNKRLYLNLGAESYFHLKRLIENKLIPSYGNADPVLRRQVTSRIADNRDGGKWRLEKKDIHRDRTKESPDRADAYVLCYYSYPLILQPNAKPATTASRESLEEFGNRIAFGDLHSAIQKQYGYTKLTGRRRSYIVPV